MAVCLQSAKECDDRSVKSFYYRPSARSNSVSTPSDEGDYEIPKWHTPKRYMPGLNLLHILSTIPFECQKLAVLSFELRSKYRTLAKGDGLTKVESTLYITKQDPGWHISIKSHDREAMKVPQLVLQAGTMSTEYTGYIYAYVRNVGLHNQVIPVGSVIGRIVCRPYQY